MSAVDQSGDGIHFQPALANGDAFYLTGEESLRVTSFNSAAGVVIAIEGRRLVAEGRSVPFVETHTPNTDRTAKTTIHFLGAGFLSNVQVRASSGSPTAGACFVLIELVRGREGAVQPLATLIQGYVTSTARLAWPGSPIVSSNTAPGFIRSFTGTNPAAGAEISEVVPAGARWRLMSVFATLVTSAVVANRQPILIIDDGANELLRSEVLVNETASVTWRNIWAAYGAYANAGGGFNGQAIPDNYVLSAGFRIRTSTVLLDPGDDWGAPQLLVEEWIAG